MPSTFRDREVTRIEASGWMRNPRLRALVAEAGLPSPVEAMAEVMTEDRWEYAEQAEVRLREHFAGFRFAPDVEWGLLLVPTPTRLDTRGALPADVRESFHSGLGEDFVDPALDAGTDVTNPAMAWTPFISVVGAYGISAGSYDDVATADAEGFTVDGADTRKAMTRQLWGARLLQAPPGVVPDSDYGETWTFTLFPGEPLVGGQAVSGTVLKGKVRFRLGKTNRGIGSARISPAIPIE